MKKDELRIAGWAARDRSGILVVGTQKPVKDDTFGVWLGFAEHMEINPQSFPQVKWEDSEPTEVELTIKIK